MTSYKYAVIFSPLLHVMHSYLLRSDTTYNYCPVSKNFDPVCNGLNSYPTDLFGPVDFTVDTKVTERSFNCSAWTAKDIKIDHTCAASGYCPINQDVVNSAIKRMNDWDYKHSLCKVREAIRYTERIRIVITGGSATSGVATYGCCCEHTHDSRCSSEPADLKTAVDSLWRQSICGQEEWSQHTSTLRCRWGSFLAQWLQSNVYGSVDVLIRAEGGATSVLR